ncbi:plasmid mobilization protein [Shewanella xiamenensis]|uniref:plasmid mobilization protein n=1 Tax=Shewanella xiamenensis TaxID=332186 RepID=UPI002E7BC119|nr:hypothetical protein [Shewanella xiamenensis]MEE1981506.1 hypothetical protein [Shewanella xiamenensis]
MATIPVSFRIPNDAHADFSDKAKNANMSLTDYFKEAIINDKSVVMAKQQQPRDRKELLFLFSKTSNNLNQIAHRAHTDNLRGVLSERSYQMIIAQLNAIRFELLEGITNADKD